MSDPFHVCTKNVQTSLLFIYLFFKLQSFKSLMPCLFYQLYKIWLFFFLNGLSIGLAMMKDLKKHLGFFFFYHISEFCYFSVIFQSSLMTCTLTHSCQGSEGWRTPPSRLVTFSQAWPRLDWQTVVLVWLPVAQSTVCVFSIHVLLNPHHCLRVHPPRFGPFSSYRHYTLFPGDLQKNDGAQGRP